MLKKLLLGALCYFITTNSMEFDLELAPNPIRKKEQLI